MTKVTEAPRTVVMEPKDVWCIWTKKGNRPRSFHATPERAHAEAERLARRNPKCKFIVMHMVGKYAAV